MSEIHGVDLTTEGVVTVNVTMERIKDYLAGWHGTRSSSPA